MPSQPFCFQICWWSVLWWYLWGHPHVCGAWCPQTSKETRQERTEGMLRLRMGWAQPSCTWLFGEEPLPKISVLTSSIHHPVEDTHWGSRLTKMRTYPLGTPGLGWVRRSRWPYLKSHGRGQRCHFRARPPQHQPTPAPGRRLAPWIFPVRSRQRSVRENTKIWRFLRARENQWRGASTLAREKVIFLGGGSPLGPSNVAKKGKVASWRPSKPF